MTVYLASKLGKISKFKVNSKYVQCTIGAHAYNHSCNLLLAASMRNICEENNIPNSDKHNSITPEVYYYTVKILQESLQLDTPLCRVKFLYFCWNLYSKRKKFREIFFGRVMGRDTVMFLSYH